MLSQTHAQLTDDSLFAETEQAAVFTEAGQRLDFISGDPRIERFTLYFRERPPIGTGRHTLFYTAGVRDIDDPFRMRIEGDFQLGRYTFDDSGKQAETWVLSCTQPDYRFIDELPFVPATPAMVN